MSRQRVGNQRVGSQRMEQGGLGPQGASRATGPAALSRRLSPVGVWALSLGCIIGWGSFILPGQLFLPQAGPAGTAIAFALAAIVMVVIAFNYSYLIRLYPVAGGEFAYVRDALGRRHAFAASWLLGLCYLALVAQNATALAVLGRSLLGGVFQVGFHYTVAGFDVYAGELALALGALAVFAVLSVRGVHLSGLFQTVLVLAMLGGVAAVVLGGIAVAGPSVLAPQPAFSPDVAPAAGVLAVLAIAPFAFVGFDTIPQAAEEYRFSPSRAKRLVVASIACGALVYIALTLVAASAVLGPGAPAGFADWPGYVAASAALQGVQSVPTFQGAATLLGPAGVALLAVAACGAVLSGIVGFYLASSRLLFAMGRDRVLPAWFAAVHPRFRTPHHAILFVMAVSAVAPFFGRTVLGWLVDMSALGAAVAYGYTSLVALRHARAHGRASVVATGALGLVFSVLFVALLLVPVPGLSASLGPQAYACLAVWVVLGVVFFASTSKKKRSDGMPAQKDAGDSPIAGGSPFTNGSPFVEGHAPAGEAPDRSSALDAEEERRRP